MQEDLDKEKKAITKQWAKRTEQIDRVMQATVGMYGDLQGIAGNLFCSFGPLFGNGGEAFELVTSGSGEESEVNDESLFEDFVKIVESAI